MADCTGASLCSATWGGRCSCTEMSIRDFEIRAERDALKAERDRLRQERDHYRENEIPTLRAEVERLKVERDAWVDRADRLKREGKALRALLGEARDALREYMQCDGYDPDLIARIDSALKGEV